MQRPAKPWTSVRLRAQPPFTVTVNVIPIVEVHLHQSPGGEIGRRKGLKIPRDLTPVPVRLRPWAPFILSDHIHLQFNYSTVYKPYWIARRFISRLGF